MITIENGVAGSAAPTASLLAFDDYSIPFRRNLALHLVPGKRGKKAPIVLANGPEGAHDEHVHYYGTTIEIDGRLHMWYIGRMGIDPTRANYEGHRGRLCYAVSDDGMHWERPELGLMEHNGSRANNLVAFPDDDDLNAAIVLYDPDDPDPQRRYKCSYESGTHGNRMCAAYSADGLHWQESPNNPVGPWIEQAGIIRHHGCYYMNGQGRHQPGLGRRLITFASYDFEHWSDGPVLGLRRSPNLSGPELEDRKAIWEEVHLGAALHDRGSCIIGIYGMFHGHPSGDRRYVGIDLGLVVSHDALHFTEPLPGFRLINAAEELDSTLGFGPALMQGQGMANIGDSTLYWYSLWRSDGQIRLARWERDRIGYLRPYAPTLPAVAVTCPFRAAGDASIALNVGGLGQHTGARVELLDLQFRPLPGFSGADAALLRDSGLEVPVRWNGGRALPSDTALRLRIDFGAVGAAGSPSVRPEDARLYAVYLNS